MVDDILLTMLLNSFFIIGLYICTREDMIFGFVERYYNTTFGILKWILTPIIGCYQCMASVWSVPFFIFAGLEWYLLVVYSVCLVSLNTLIGKLSGV